jgi:hypothetical protein
MHITVDELLRYTDEERGRWENWFAENSEDLLSTPIAGDRETTIGGLIVHIFGPELRSVQRLRGEALSEYRGRPCATLAEVFGFGIATRQALRGYLAQVGPSDWNRVVDFSLGPNHARATVRKIVLSSLFHEVRHWAQIARLVRERGFAPPEDHDLLTSAALE